MSERERGGEISAEQVGALLAIAVALIMVVIIVLDKENVSELRDLQRRVGQLESEKR